MNDHRAAKVNRATIEVHCNLLRLPSFLVLLAALTGCGKDDGIGPTVPVQGRVTLDGKSLSTGTVVFRPDPSKSNANRHEPRGVIDAEGNYTLSTGTGPTAKNGVPPGWYKVGVVSLKEPDDRSQKGGMPPPPVSLIPSRYGNPDSSGLSIQVVEGAAVGSYDLKLSN